MQGRFRLGGRPAEIAATGDGFTVERQDTRAFSVRDPAELPWKSLGVDYVLESTGLFTDFEKASGHLKAGAKRVVISAPTKSDPEQVPTICLGVNDDAYDPGAAHRHQQRELHDQLPRAGGEGDPRQRRARGGPDDDRARRHRDAADAGRTEQEGLARRPERLPEHHPGEHRRGQGGRRCASRR